jgi:hypothetical protein
LGKPVSKALSIELQSEGSIYSRRAIAVDMRIADNPEGRCDEEKVAFAATRKRYLPLRAKRRLKCRKTPVMA